MHLFNVVDSILWSNLVDVDSCLFLSFSFKFIVHCWCCIWCGILQFWDGNMFWWFCWGVLCGWNFLVVGCSHSCVFLWFSSSACMMVVVINFSWWRKVMVLLLAHEDLQLGFSGSVGSGLIQPAFDSGRVSGWIFLMSGLDWVVCYGLLMVAFCCGLLMLAALSLFMLASLCLAFLVLFWRLDLVSDTFRHWCLIYCSIFCIGFPCGL